MQKYKNTGVYGDECTDNQVCKLFALTDGIVTWGLLATPQGKEGRNTE